MKTQKKVKPVSGFDDKILSIYARGMSTREIQGHLREMYEVEVSPSLISEVTDAIMEGARAWQSRPHALEVRCPFRLRWQIATPPPPRATPSDA
jgi:transposase-like protein